MLAKQLFFSEYETGLWATSQSFFDELGQKGADAFWLLAPAFGKDPLGNRSTGGTPPPAAAVTSLGLGVNWGYEGCCATGAPAVASWGPERRDIFVRGIDGYRWLDWIVVDTRPLLTKPVAIATGTGSVEVWTQHTAEGIDRKEFPLLPGLPPSP